jgi:hypothetical protein
MKLLSADLVKSFFPTKSFLVAEDLLLISFESRFWFPLILKLGGIEIECEHVFIVVIR